MDSPISVNFVQLTIVAMLICNIVQMVVLMACRKEIRRLENLAGDYFSELHGLEKINLDCPVGRTRRAGVLGFLKMALR